MTIIKQSRLGGQLDSSLEGELEKVKAEKEALERKISELERQLKG